MCWMQSFYNEDIELEKEKAKTLLKHFEPVISKEIVDYVNDSLLLESRYLFVSRLKRQQYAYCTHCHQSSKVDGLKHNEKSKCQFCGSVCTVKSDGRKRSNLIDRAYFVWYEKSTLDKDTIVARGITVKRDYSGDITDVKTEYCEEVWYIFKPNNKPVMIKKGYYSDSFKLCKTIYSLGNNHSSNLYMTAECPKFRIEEAVKDTIFQYSAWNKISKDHPLLKVKYDFVDYFELFSEYPQVEFLEKAGLINLIELKLSRASMMRTVNWRGKTLESALGITMQQFKELKKKNIEINVPLLYFMRQSKKRKWNMSIDEFSEVVNACKGTLLKEQFIQVSKFVKPTRIMPYIKKQHEVRKDKCESDYSILITWKDYLRDCEILNLNMDEDIILFPKNIFLAHEHTIKQVKNKKNEELRSKIENRSKRLSKLSYENEEFIIRPIESVDELVEEGNRLKHCVGRYAEQYASGKTAIFVIREKCKTKKPFYTVEIINKQVVQVRGHKNVGATEEVEAFMTEFKSERLVVKRPVKENTTCQI